MRVLRMILNIYWNLFILCVQIILKFENALYLLQDHFCRKGCAVIHFVVKRVTEFLNINSVHKIDECPTAAKVILSLIP